MKPPLPTASNFPFHVSAAGSQTSKRICESLVGAENASTRQNGTVTWRSAPGPAGPCVSGNTRSGGGLIAVADVIVALGITTDVSVAQDCCAEVRAGTNAKPARRTNNRNAATRCLIRTPPRDVLNRSIARNVYTARTQARKDVLLSGESMNPSGSRRKKRMRTRWREGNLHRRNNCAHTVLGRCDLQFATRAGR